MNDVQIALVKRTWRVFRDIDPLIIGDVFYCKLFTETPGLRRLFPKSMEEQYQKLVNMISQLVAGLDKVELLEPEIVALSRRHIGYGVRPAHYKLVGKALLWTLEQGLGNDWTPEVKNAWTHCYNEVATAMIEAVED